MPELPFLNLDAATARALPHVAREARADARVFLSSPEGEKICLLARLCQSAPGSYGGDYEVILCAENGPSDWVFSVCKFSHCAEDNDGDQRRLNYSMRARDAANFHWFSFEQMLNTPDAAFWVARFWEVEGTAGLGFVRFLASGFVDFFDEAGQSLERELGAVISWRAEHLCDWAALDWAMRASREELRATFDDPDGHIQFALRWRKMSGPEAQKLAFGCARGDWSQVRRVAMQVFLVRLTREERLDSWESWDLVGGAPTRGVWHDDAALLLWRAALNAIFGSLALGFTSVLPSCLRFYLGANAQGEIEIETRAFSQHEILEAHLQLKTWAHAHFSPRNAQILLDSLAQFSESEAQDFRDSLGLER